MVDAFDHVGFSPPVKLGHDSKGSDPAYGWVERIYRKGKTLYADLKDIPAEIYKKIKDRSYDHVSSEIFWNLERAGKKFSRVLKAVALLGAETPAVSGLAPLRTVVHARGRWDGVHVYTVKKEDLEMDRIKELSDKIAEYEAKLRAGDGDKAKVAELTQQLETARTEREKVYGQLAAENEQLKGTVTKLTDTVGQMLERDRQATIRQHAEACKVPALRPLLIGLFDLASQGTSVHKYTEGDKTLDLSGTELLSRLVAEINKGAARLFTVVSQSGAPSGDAIDSSGQTPDLRVQAAAQEYQSKHPEVKKFSDAVKAVLRADPALATAYAQFTTSRQSSA
jgi:hypothetical protein